VYLLGYVLLIAKISFGELKIKIDKKGQANGNDRYSI